MRIGDLARLVGVSPRTVRHYHRVGVLPEPGRTSNGYREYGVQDAVLLVRARRLVEVGLALEDIAAVLVHERRLDLSELLSELAADLDHREHELQAQRQRIAALQSRLTGSTPLADALDPAGLVEFFDAVRGAGARNTAAEKDRQLLSMLPHDAAARVSEVLAEAVPDEEAAARITALYERFDALADGPPPSREVIDGLAAAVLSAMPAPLIDQARTQLHAGSTADLGWITDELSPGQRVVIDAMIQLIADTRRVM